MAWYLAALRSRARSDYPIAPRCARRMAMCALPATTPCGFAVGRAAAPLPGPAAAARRAFRPAPPTFAIKDNTAAHCLLCGCQGASMPHAAMVLRKDGAQASAQRAWPAWRRVREWGRRAPAVSAGVHKAALSLRHAMIAPATAVTTPFGK